MTGKSKIVQAPSLVETLPNKQQSEIDVDARCTALISKNILLFVFQFLETPCLKLLRVFDNLKHVDRLFQTVDVKQDNVFWSEHAPLDGCFSFKMKDLYLFDLVQMVKMNIVDNSHLKKLRAFEEMH